MGARETDTRYEVLPTAVLPGYGTYSLTAAVTLGDATMTLCIDGLENERHPETWADISQPGGTVLARDSGRQYRFELVWPLFN